MSANTIIILISIIKYSEMSVHDNVSNSQTNHITTYIILTASNKTDNLVYNSIFLTDQTNKKS
jgi:hypothetical protein